MLLIHPHEGVKELTSLPVCPVVVRDKHGNGKRRDMIMESSKVLFKSLREGYMLARYDGPVLGTTQYACLVI